jgi:hypothetical protein
VVQRIGRGLSRRKLMGKRRHTPEEINPQAYQRAYEEVTCSTSVIRFEC